MERFQYYEGYGAIQAMPGTYQRVANAAYSAFNSYWRMGYDIGGIGSNKGILSQQAEERYRQSLAAALPDLAPFLPESLLLRDRKGSSFGFKMGPNPEETMVTTIVENITYFLPRTQEVYSFTPMWHSLKGSTLPAEAFNPENPLFKGFDKAREKKSHALIFGRTDFSQDWELAKVLAEIDNQISDEGKEALDEFHNKIKTIDEETETTREARRIYYGNLLQFSVNVLRDAILDCALSEPSRIPLALRRRFINLKAITLSGMYHPETGQSIVSQRRLFFIRTGSIGTLSDRNLEPMEWTRSHNADLAIKGLIGLLPNEEYRETIRGLWEPACHHAQGQIREENPS